MAPKISIYHAYGQWVMETGYLRNRVAVQALFGEARQYAGKAVSRNNFWMAFGQLGPAAKGSYEIGRHA
jgi:hypothetical protein